MEGFWIAAVSAFWFGILTSISPCPMATNIAAVSLVSRHVGSLRRVIGTGLLYTTGRILTYLILGIALVKGLTAAPMLSHVLQKYMNLAMGPLLIIVGMILLELLTFKSARGGFADSLSRRIEGMGIYGSFFLGMLFALSFCPTSAALFFGSLIPLSLQFQSSVILPSVYGVATGLPVLVFAFLLAFSANKVARLYDRLAHFEIWAQRTTGVIFLAVGIYFSITLTMGIRLW